MVGAIFKEMVQKLAHIKVQEYLDAFKQKGAAQKESTSLAGQNLCDSLLTHHINLKTKQWLFKSCMYALSNCLFNCIHIASFLICHLTSVMGHLCN